MKMQKIKAISHEIDRNENITPSQFAELIRKYGFKDELDKN